MANQEGGMDKQLAGQGGQNQQQGGYQWGQGLGSGFGTGFHDSHRQVFTLSTLLLYFNYYYYYYYYFIVPVQSCV